MIPIDVDPEQFLFKTPTEEFNDCNSLHFKLHVVCTRKAKFKNTSYEQLSEMDPTEYLDNSEVLASDLQWTPIGNQAKTFPNGVKSLFPGILITKLREN